ncbi:hypothetical protein J6590_057903, partial [Homalodisca vitripennis]
HDTTLAPDRNAHNSLLDTAARRPELTAAHVITFLRSHWSVPAAQTGSRSKHHQVVFNLLSPPPYSPSHTQAFIFLPLTPLCPPSAAPASHPEVKRLRPPSRHSPHPRAHLQRPGLSNYPVSWQ